MRQDDSLLWAAAIIAAIAFALVVVLMIGCTAEQALDQGNICCKYANGGTECVQPLASGSCPAGTS
jgi:hypothetical protein